MPGEEVAVDGSVVRAAASCRSSMTSKKLRRRIAGLEKAIRDCLSDSDEDGLPDDWEQYYFSNLNETGSGDPDQDGLVNLQEFQCGSNPVDPYSKCLKTLPWLILLME